jgi:two-component system, cell cycle response regulator DivK
VQKVLVIEDNPDNLRLISYALEHAGYQVESAVSGEAGIARLPGLNPVFVVMDINLPGIDGYETTSRIRELGYSKAELPIVAITSNAMAGDRNRAIGAGCNAYFEKPIDPLVIVEQIEQTVGIRRGL